MTTPKARLRPKHSPLATKRSGPILSPAAGGPYGRWSLEQARFALHIAGLDGHPVAGAEAVRAYLAKLDEVLREVAAENAGPVSALAKRLLAAVDSEGE